MHGSFIGAGTMGEAWACQGGVMKVQLAADKSSMQRKSASMEKLLKLGPDSPYARVSDFGVVGLISDPMVPFRRTSGFAYYYVMEKLLPLSPQTAKEASRVLKSLSKIIGDEKMIERFIRTEKKRLAYEAHVENKSQRTDKWTAENIDGGDLGRALDLFERMVASGTLHGDYNPQNIMQDSSGRMKFIDLDLVQDIDEKLLPPL